MSVRFILGQLSYCEDREGVMPATEIEDLADENLLSSTDMWDSFLIKSDNDCDNEEVVEGLFIRTIQGIVDGGESSRFIELRTRSRNRVHFAGFLNDLIPRLRNLTFQEALRATLIEWRQRWGERVESVSFNERIGLFGELIVLRDFLSSEVGRCKNLVR